MTFSFGFSSSAEQTLETVMGSRNRVELNERFLRNVDARHVDATVG